MWSLTVFFTNNLKGIVWVSRSWSYYSWHPYFILYICHSSSWSLQLPLQLNMPFQISSGMYTVRKRGQDVQPFVALIPCKKSRVQLRVTFKRPVKLNLVGNFQSYRVFCRSSAGYDLSKTVPRYSLCMTWNTISDLYKKYIHTGFAPRMSWLHNSACFLLIFSDAQRCPHFSCDFQDCHLDIFQIGLLLMH